MRILHVIFSHINNPLSAGGSAVRTHEVYKRMAARHEITVVTAAWPGGPKEEVIDGVRYLHLGRPRGAKGWSRAGFAWTMNWVALNAKRKWGADLLVVDISPFTPCFAPWLAKVPVIGVVQSWIDYRDAKRKHGAIGPWAVRVRDKALRGYRYLIAVSPTILDALSETCNGKAAMKYVPNGVEQRLFDVQSHDGDYFLFIGRIERFTKGLDLLIEAFHVFARRGHDTRLVVAGDGDFRADLETFVREKGLIDRVEFVGWVEGDRKLSLLSGCMCVCVSSRRESWGLTAVEAAACGKPVIGFDVPGVRDAVRNGETGILVPAEDVEAYAEAMVRISQDLQLRKRLGMAGREWARKFSWEETARKQEEFYTEVLEQEARK